MAGIALAEAEAKLTAVQDAIDAILNRGAASYSIAGRSFTGLDAGILMEMETHYEKKVIRLSRGGIGIKGGTPT